MPTPHKKKRPTAINLFGTSPSATINASTFKAQCLALMDLVNRTGQEIIVTKHDRPVAKLVSARAPVHSRRFFGRSEGRIRVVGDPVAPLNPEWRVEEDL